MVSSHGLATSVQSTTESTTYDLAGLSKDGIVTALTTALSNPLVLPPGSDAMIRLTFVVGAGKNTRQRYDADAHKAVTSTLDKLGYSEDRGASCVAECGGSYKLQHDTGKNLKTVVVFPFVESADSSGTDGDRNATDGAAAGCLIPENSPGYKIAVCSLPTFRALLTNQCGTWSEKRGCLESLAALRSIVQECDDKLMNGQMLDEEEQNFYDAVVDLSEKEAHAKEEATAMVEAGKLTANERDILLEQNAERIAALKKEGKKVPDKVLKRKALLEGISSPISAPRLRHESKIAKLYKELGPLQRMEDAAKGRLLSVKETQTLARKEEILEEIEYLEQSSQGWFEEDDIFHQRVEACRQKHAKVGGGKKAGAGGGKRVTATSASLNKIRAPTANNKWVVPGAGGGWNSKTGTKDKKKKSKGGAIFTAMMMDSDSDDDEEDEEESVDEEQEEKTNEDDTNVTSAGRTSGGLVASENETPLQSSAPSVSTSFAGTGKKKSKASKKKNKKKGGGSTGTTNASSADESRALEAAVAENTATQSKGQDKEHKEEQTAIVQVWTFLTTYIFPLILGLLAWIIGLLFGTAKKNKKKKTR